MLLNTLITQCLITLTCDLITLFELGSGCKDKITSEKHISGHEASGILLQY